MVAAVETWSRYTIKDLASLPDLEQFEFIDGR